MNCPFCNHSKTNTIDTRHSGQRVIRKRKCKACQEGWETVELFRKDVHMLTDRQLERLIYAGVIIHD